MARVEELLEADNVRTETSQNSTQDGVYIARMIVRVGLRLTVRIMKVTKQEQVLSESTTIGHGEPAVWAAAFDDQ
jgi:hypothetical protein